MIVGVLQNGEPANCLSPENEEEEEEEDKAVT
jgi:hypothetical protein